MSQRDLRRGEGHCGADGGVAEEPGAESLLATLAPVTVDGDLQLSRRAEPPLGALIRVQVLHIPTPAERSCQRHAQSRPHWQGPQGHPDPHTPPLMSQMPLRGDFSQPAEFLTDVNTLHASIYYSAQAGTMRNIICIINTHLIRNIERESSKAYTYRKSRFSYKY